ncbi:DNA polymerase I [Abyssibacter sp.]|uniref:DNA polymerase I n=1 Tax=Abyssibacter sp. TaxID=2320200 RepID=UPI0035190846
MSADNTLYLLDGSSWLYRAFHALPPLTNSSGEPTGAVFGMGNMLRKLLAAETGDHIAVIFDPRGKTFRHALDANYKANRPPVPPELADQFEPIRTLVDGLGLPMLQIDGVEADDVIGTLAKQAEAAGWKTVIVTGDKDMAQIVSDQVLLYDTMKDKRMDPVGVVEKFGVGPERIIDLLALMGDTSDNIPGVPKVGPKTAAKWLNAHGDLDSIIANADAIGGKVGESLREHLDQLPKSRELATIRCDVELPLTFDALTRGEQKTDVLRELYQRMDFHRWLTDLDDQAPPPAADAPDAPAQVQYHTVLSQDALDALVQRLETAELICLDTETDALDAITGGLVGLSFAVEPGEAWYVPVAHDYMGAPDQLDRQHVLNALRPVLEGESPSKVGQHLKYDINVLAHHGVTVRGVDYDTMLESYLLDPTAGRHDMDSLAERVLNVKTTSFTDIAGKGKKQLSFNQIDLEQATPYAAEDADITLRLHQQLWKRLSNEPGQRSVFESLEIPLVQVLARVERHGVLIDAGHLRTITHEMAGRMREMEESAYAAAGGEFNLNSPGQLKDILFDRLGLPVKRKTPKGQPSTAEDVLSELAQEHPLPQMILDWRGLAKLRSTYTEKLPERINPITGRVHTSYHQAVAATGRLSSSEPNLQNIPIRTKEGRRIREAFVAPPGHRLVAIDYSQIELRLMAHFSGDESMIAAFVNGRDIHRNTAAEVWGLEPEAVTDEQRRAAKAINFGLIYGISAFGLARNLNIGRDEAQSHMNAFFTRYPGVKDYMERCKAGAKEQGYVETLAGRRLYLPDIGARNQQARQYAERTAINAPLQGTAADLIKQAMIDIDRWLQGQDAPAKMIMQVHDELVFEVPDAQAQTLAKALAERMEAVGQGLSVPLIAEFGIGANWDEAHG